LLVGKSISSSTNALSRYGIEMKSGGDKTSRLNDLVGTLNKKFGGFAEREGKTAEGRLAKISNFMGDINEAIGQEFLSKIDKMGSGFDVLNNAEKIIKNVRRGIRGLIIVAEALALPLIFPFKALRVLAAPIVAIFQNIKTIIQTVKDSFLSLGGAIAIIRDKGIGGFGEAVDLLKGSFTGLKDTGKKVFDDTKKNVAAAADSILNDFRSIRDGAVELFTDAGIGDDIFTAGQKANIDEVEEKKKEATATELARINKLLETTKQTEQEKLQVKIDSLNAFLEEFALSSEQINNIVLAREEYERQQLDITNNVRKKNVLKSN
ncbi:hypothetical protein LCGC14_2670930, partial [marine sediment metagenome]